MARFVYRMQSVLNVKVQLESQAKNEYGLAQARLLEEEEKLHILQQRREEYEQMYRDSSSGVLDLRQMQEAKEATLRMDDFILLQQDVILRAEEAVEEKRQKLTVAIQERKIQERLRERAFEEFLAEEKAAESKEIDELTSYTYGQRIEE